MLRKAPWAIPLLAVLIGWTALVPIAQSGTTGKLTGKARGEKKEALAGVNIRIEGQRLGAITDEQGNFVIVGVPAGSHVVRANLIGYAASVVEKVTINPDFTTELVIDLKTEAVQLTEVRVEAQRPLLQKDATGTARFLDAEEIQKLPTRGYRDAASNQTGVVNFQRQIDGEVQNANTLIIRGGRPNETAYFVDGFSQQDPLTGTSSTAISNNSIQEVVLLTGGFAPEYGRIMSGAVNVITREGQSKYFGAVEAVSDLLSGEWVQAARTDYNVYDASLGGPVIPGRDNLTFYVSGERRWQRDRQPTFLPDRFRSELRSIGLDDEFKPNNQSGGFTYQGKLAFQLNDAMSLKAGTLGSEEDWRQYTHAYLFDLDHTPRYEDRNQSYFSSFNHVLNTKTFYNIGVNFFQTERKRGDGVAFDDLTPSYVSAGQDTLVSNNGQIANGGTGYFRNPNPRFDINAPMFFDNGHVFEDYLQRSSNYVGVQGSLASQIDRYNQLKVGGDFQRHTLRFFNHFFPDELGGTSPNLSDYDAYGYDLVPTYRTVTIRDITGPDTTYSTRQVLSRVDLRESDDGATDGPKHPKSFSFFVQDKYEREGVIVNGGLRYDHINVDTQSLVSEGLPLGDPEDPFNNAGTLDPQDLEENKTYSRISPRLGIAFPVDDKTILRFNYGQFYQQPNLQDLYVSYRFLEYKIRRGGYFVGFGNPNLRPEQTTAYEVGFARQVGDNVRMDITAYYKDVKDLVQIATVPSFPNNFSSYRNQDFATVKGIDLGFTMRPTNHIGANLAYSLSFAQGTGSVSQTNRFRAWTAAQPPKQTAPLDFDQRHKVSMNVDWRLANDEGPMLGGFRPFENAGINMLFNVGSGTPYTPSFVYNELTLAAVTASPSDPINSRYGPWSVNLDLKANRGFKLSGLDLEGYVWVLNVFDHRNPINLYTSSGDPSSTTWLNTQDGQGFLDTAAGAGIDGEALYRLAENNPNNFSNPRLVRFGVRASF